MDKLSLKIIKVIRSVIPENDGQLIPLHAPCFKGNEWSYVKECLDSTFVSSVGKYVDQFERMLQDYTGVKRAVAVVNGTAALHLALQLSGVIPGDEVLMPAFTFVATANAVTYLNATPHFADIEKKTLGIDPDKLKDYLSDIAVIKDDVCINKYTQNPIRAMVPMHTFGHPVDLDSLFDLCRQYKLKMVEDAAEAIGSFYKGRHVGNWGDLSVLSFNGNKTITTGGGGAILTNDENLADRAKYLTTTAKVPHPSQYFHDQIGYNYRMPNINAALGCAQMEALPDFIHKKRALAKQYQNAFQNLKGIECFQEPDFAESNYWLNAIIMDNMELHERNRIIEDINAQNIMVRPAWTLMDQLPMFKDCPKMDLGISEQVEQSLINIPSSPVLSNIT